MKSAGVEVHGVNPKAIAIMREDGVDISSQTSNHVDEYLSIEFDYVITVCDNAKERCPVLPVKAQKLHCNFSDPAKAIGSAEEVHEKFKETREQIKKYCRDFVLNTSTEADEFSTTNRVESSPGTAKKLRFPVYQR